MDLDVKEALGEIKEDIKEIKQDINEHIRRTAAAEARIDMMEEFVKAQAASQEKVLNIIVQQAEKARIDQGNIIKITLGIFTAIAALVSALAAWFKLG